MLAYAYPEVNKVGLLDQFDLFVDLLIQRMFDVLYSKEERAQRQRHRDLFKRLSSRKQSWVVTVNSRNTIFTTQLDGKDVVLENRYCGIVHYFLLDVDGARYVDILSIGNEEVYHGPMKKNDSFPGKYCGLVDKLSLTLELRYYKIIYPQFA